MDSKELEYIEIIEKSSVKLNEFVEDLLIYSKANSQDLKRSNFSFQNLVDEITDSYELTIKKDGIIIDSIDCDLMIYVDRIKFRQVFQNLINNSIKFRSADRPLKIVISCTSNDKDQVFTIVDNGIGISDEYKTKVFKEFTQLNPQKYEGTGMGLSIVRNIINKHNGTINLKNNEPYGLKVEITLPIEKEV